MAMGYIYMPVQIGSSNFTQKFLDFDRSTISTTKSPPRSDARTPLFPDGDACDSLSPEAPPTRQGCQKGGVGSLSTIEAKDPTPQLPPH
jgi:hypothetical protein